MHTYVRSGAVINGLFEIRYVRRLRLGFIPPLYFIPLALSHLQYFYVPYLKMSVRSVIWSSMSHLSREERQEAVEMLVFIGLINSQTYKLDINSLRQTFGKIISVWVHACITIILYVNYFRR